MISKLPITKKNRGYFLAFMTLLGALVFSSCNKNDDIQTAQPATGSIKFLNALPKYSSLDFYLGNQRATNPALLLGQSTGYFSVYTGTGEVYAVTGGTFQILGGTTLNIENGKNYSIFSTTKSTADNADTVLVIQDNLTAPAAGKAKVRFANFVSDNSAALDLGTQGGTTNFFTNSAFNASTDFIEVDPGSYVFQIKDTGTSTVKASSTSTTIASGRIYTVWAKGRASGSGTTAIGIQVSEN